MDNYFSNENTEEKIKLLLAGIVVGYIGEYIKVAITNLIHSFYNTEQESEATFQGIIAAMVTGATIALTSEKLSIIQLAFLASGLILSINTTLDSYINNTEVDYEEVVKNWIIDGIIISIILFIVASFRKTFKRKNKRSSKEHGDLVLVGIITSIPISIYASFRNYLRNISE